MAVSLVETWRKIIIGDEKSWVLFQHGTCVILMQPEQDLTVQALEIMKQWGPVHAGSSAGDFSTVALTNYPGWIVTGHHPDMLNYVSPDDFEDNGPSDVAIGLRGRFQRNQDAEDLQVLHVEDKRHLP